MPPPNLCKISLQLIILTFYLALLPLPLRADVATDGTVGPARSLAGPDYLIPVDLGATAGDNLFHSFNKFSLTMDETATFTGPGHIANVISRVTGGEISNIDGLLQSQVGQADFFFINPAGIVFGPNARVDVPAAFHVSTADALCFSDDSVFSAKKPDASMLSVAAPESFGFVSPQPASIAINGSQLEFSPGSSLSISAGDLKISGTERNKSSLISQSGHIRLAAFGDAMGEFPIETDFSGSVTGELRITSAQINASGNGGGRISINAGDTELNDARISNDNPGNRHAEGGTALSANGHVEMGNNTSISVNTFGDGEGGSVSITAGKLKMEGGSGEGFASIYSLTEYGSGDAGNVSVNVQGFLELINGAEISSNTLSDGNAGNVVVTAHEIKIDGGGSSKDTGISSSAVYGSGNAGTVQVNARDRLDLINNAIISNDTFTPGEGGPMNVTVEGLMMLTAGAEISSDTFSEGKPGNMTITAGNLLIDGGEDAKATGISSKSDDYSLAEAGAVNVMVEGWLKMRNGAGISSDTYSESNAGKVTVSAREINIDEGGSGEFTGISSSARYGRGSAGKVEVNAKDLLEIINGARILSGTYTPGNAGTVTVTVEGLLKMINGAEISSSTQGEGNAGIVSIMANELRMNGNGRYVTNISSQAFSESQGDAGEVEVNVAGLLELLKGAAISSNTSAEGHAGNVTVNAGSLRIDEGQTDEFTGISSEASYGTGDAGTVDVHVNQGAELINTAMISSSTITTGEAGEVKVAVGGLLKMINGAEITSETSSAGSAGDVNVAAGELLLDGRGLDKFTAISSNTYDESGDAGTVTVTVRGLLNMVDGAEIVSDTYSDGDAGKVSVSAGVLKMEEGGSGMRTSISSEAAYGTGNAGTVSIRADDLIQLIDNSTISSSTSTEGKAGTVTVTVRGVLELLNGAKISSHTSDAGNAGSVAIEATDLRITGEASVISSLAESSATGFAGNIRIQADTITLSDKCQISIAAYQTLSGHQLINLPANSIHIDADRLHLQESSRITAESTANVPASAIEIQAQNIVVEKESRITTSSNNADGGPIDIQGDSTVLRQGLISTSVEGFSGNGGDITITGSSPADVLVMQEGFIQANTAAEGASGGNISIDARAVIAEAKRLAVGGQERRTFEPGKGLNVIQAAAPGGEQGTIRIIAPELDLAGSLLNLTSSFIAPVRLATDPCKTVGGKKASSLVIKGRGGIPAGPDEPSTVPLDKNRLERLR